MSAPEVAPIAKTAASARETASGPPCSSARSSTTMGSRTRPCAASRSTAALTALRPTGSVFGDAQPDPAQRFAGGAGNVQRR